MFISIFSSISYIIIAIVTIIIIITTIIITILLMMMVAVCFCGIVDQKKRRLALFPAGTIIRDPHHGEFPTRREQELNLRRI